MFAKPMLQMAGVQGLPCLCKEFKASFELQVGAWRFRLPRFKWVACILGHKWERGSECLYD